MGFDIDGCMEGARRYSKAGRVDMVTVATRLWSFIVNNKLEEGGRRFESNSPYRGLEILGGL
jgi:hypothetical protein